MAYTDPKQEQEYKKQWYQRNKESVSARARRNTPRYIERNRKFVRKIKESAPCTDCSKYFSWYVMDFDHLRDKFKTVSVMVSSGCSIKALQQEIDKCEIVCANCHRERTFGGMVER